MIVRRALKKYASNQAGAAAIEFALVAPMLLALIFSTLEAGWTMVQTIMLDRALDMTVRELRIGKIANPTQASVRAHVCDDAMVLFDCNKNLALEFIPITSEASYPTDTDRCVDRSTAIAPLLRFDAGGRSQNVFVRACFVVDPLTPGLGIGMALPKDSTGAFRIIAKSAYANEPL
jgi:Flp pilus assembly pilin Flp